MLVAWGTGIAVRKQARPYHLPREQGRSEVRRIPQEPFNLARRLRRGVNHFADFKNPGSREAAQFGVLAYDGQSTLFAAVVGLLTLVLRRNHAQVRAQ